MTPTQSLTLSDLDAALAELAYLTRPQDEGTVQNIRQRLGWVRERIAKSEALMEEPMVENAVEAALDAYYKNSNRPQSSIWSAAMSRAIAAADAARGRSYVVWRKPGEYSQADGSDILARYVVKDAVNHEFTLAISRTVALPPEVVAWAEMPESPVQPWSPVTATGHTDLMVAPEALSPNASPKPSTPAWTPEKEALLAEVVALVHAMVARTAGLGAVDDLRRLMVAATLYQSAIDAAP